MKKFLFISCLAAIASSSIAAPDRAEGGPYEGGRFRGRIAWSADGNHNDPDDWAASPVALAIFAEAGIKDRLVHFDYNCILPVTDPEWEKAHAESVLGAAERYGYDRSTFFDCRRDLDGAVASLVGAIDASTADDPLYFITAGPMEVPFMAIEKSDPARRKFVYCISHSEWNDGYNQKPQYNRRTKRDVIAAGVHWVQIPHQGLLSTSPYGRPARPEEWRPWHWMRDSADPKVQFLWERMRASTRPDCSDAGMAYFLATGDQEADPAELGRLLDGHEVPAPISARRRIRIEAENFRDLEGCELYYRNDRTASQRTSVKATKEAGRLGTRFDEPYAAARGRYDVDVRYFDEKGRRCRFTFLVNGTARGPAWETSGQTQGWTTRSVDGVEIGVGDELTVEFEGSSGRLDCVQLNDASPAASVDRPPTSHDESLDPPGGGLMFPGPGSIDGRTGWIPRLIRLVTPALLVHSRELPTNAGEGAPAGRIIIDPEHPQWLMREGSRHVFICGPGDPEDFLYAGRRNPDGTRDGDQVARIRKLIEHGGNCIYMQVVRTHGGDAKRDRTQNPFVDSDPARGLDEDILDQAARVQAIAEAVRRADDRGHLIGDHHLSGTTFKAWRPGGALDHFSMQVGASGDAHAGAVEALRKAAGRYQVIYSESTAIPTDPDGMRRHAWAVSMGGVMPMLPGMDIAGTLVEVLHQYRFLQRFFEASDFYTTSPHDELKCDGTRYVLADPGRSYIAYADDLSGKLGVRDLPAGEFAVTWLDCRTGRTVAQARTISRDGDHAFDRPPEIGSECAAWIRRGGTPSLASAQPPRSGEVASAGRSNATPPSIRPNRPPLVKDTEITGTTGIPAPIQLAFEDEDGPGPYTYTLVRGPGHGTLTGDNNDRVYTPEAGFVGTDRFAWKVNDGVVDSKVASVSITVAAGYFPPPESLGGWRTLDDPDEIRRIAGMDPAKLRELERWLLDSDRRNFAAVVIRRGHIVLEVERGSGARTDARRVASVSKAICATVLAIASELSQQGKTPRKMTFNDPAFSFIPWAEPLSDPRKAQITVKQLFNHTSGICPEATGARNEGTWEYILGHTGDERTAELAFDPGTACGYSTHALHHAALVCETVTGKPYDAFAIEALFRPLGIERWTFLHLDGDAQHGRHASHSLGLPARELARIGYCMLREGRWGTRQVVPRWFVAETAASTHRVTSPELRFKINAQVFSHGWELPARHDGERDRGLPADARYKPGSGGQLLAFVPSLDLVIARQTGGSGEWAYDEFLRRACAAVLPEEAAPRPVASKAFKWEAATPESQGISTRKLEGLREGLAARNTRALLVIRDDKIVAEWYAPGNSAATRHGTASLAKAIVGGVSLAVAMDDGRIALDDPAAKFIPQWKEEPRKSRITIRQLGSHTSGLADAEAEGKKHEELTGWEGDFWKRRDPPNDPFTISRDLTPLMFDPGTSRQYSNPGIAMMSYAVTAALRDAPAKDIRTLLRDRIMRPIGVPDEEWACGYGKTFTVDGLPLVGSWGGGTYTARAAARIGRLMLRRGDWEGERLLGPEAVRQTTGSSGLPGAGGMGWWTNAEGRCPELPADAFWGAGAGGQVLLVVPSMKLIVVRNGGNLADGDNDRANSRFLFAQLMEIFTGETRSPRP